MSMAASMAASIGVSAAGTGGGGGCKSVEWRGHTQVGGAMQYRALGL